MCDRLGQLRDAVSRYATAFDPSVLSAEQAATVVADAAAIERMAATLKGLAAARAAEAGAWKDTGDRSAAHHLARTTGPVRGPGHRGPRDRPAPRAAARGGRGRPGG
jgi:hypothetical protein